MASGRQIAACLILVLVALSIVACGGDSPQGPKIPADIAVQLDNKLDVVKSRLTPEKQCGSNDTAQTSLDSLQGYVDEVAQQDIDPQIISNLRELIDGIDQKVAAECAAGGITESTSTTTETTSTETDTKTTTDQSTTDTDTDTDTDTETDTTKPTTTTTDPNQETPTPPDNPTPNPPNNGGGNGNGGGATQGGFEAGGTAPGDRVPANGGSR